MESQPITAEKQAETPVGEQTAVVTQYPELPKDIMWGYPWPTPEQREAANKSN